MRTASYWEAGSTVRVGDQQRQGVAAMGGAGIVRSFFRNSVSWAQDPGSGLWVKVPFATEPVNADGLTLRPGRTNLLARSSFVSGTTGLTPTVGSGAIALDTAQTAWMFDDSVQATQQSLKFTAGNPNITGPIERWPDSADPNSYWSTTEPIQLAIYHRDDGGEALSYSLLDVTKTRYWDKVADAWGAAAGPEVFNTITLGAATGWTCYSEPIFAHAAGATSLRLRIKMPDGGTASRINHVAHVELQGLDTSVGAPYYSPLVVSDATSPVTRYGDNLMLIGTDPIPGDDFTILMRWSPEWPGSVPAEGSLWWFRHGMVDASGTQQSDIAQGFYVVDAQTVTFEVTDGAAASSATKVIALDGGTTYDLAFRYVGGIPDVFVDGEKGTSGVAFATTGWTGPFRVGYAEQLSTLYEAVPCGAIKRFAILPYALTDAEIASEAL